MHLYFTNFRHINSIFAYNNRFALTWRDSMNVLSAQIFGSAISKLKLNKIAVVTKQYAGLLPK